jgi:hypothetical protein
MRDERSGSTGATISGRPRVTDLARTPPTLADCRRWLAAALIAAVAGVIVMWRLGEYPSRLLVAAGLVAFVALYATYALRGIELTPKRLEALSEFAVFAMFLAFYAATAGNDSSPFNAHIRQAYSLWHAHIWIDAPNYIEHAQVGGFSYQLHPLLPAFLLMPVVAFWGMDTNQTFVAIIFGALDAALAWRMLGRFHLTTSARTWLAIFFGAGTILWSESINGGSWEVSMVVAIAFTLLALDETFGASRPLWIGILAGLAALARYDLAFVWPFYVVLVYSRRRQLAELAEFVPGFLLAAIVYVLFNELRYHSLFDRGVFIFAPPGSRLFALPNFPGNIYTLLFMAPSVNGNFPYIHPTFGGQALILTSPAFVLALRPSYRKFETAMVALAALVAMTPSLFYFTNGFSQFGTRHYLHAFPFLLVLMAIGVHRRADQMTRILIVVSVFLIAFGVWHIRWYGYG